MTNTKESQPRVPLLSKDEALKRAREVGLPEQMAGLSVFRALLNHPVVAQKLSATLNTLLFDANKLDVRLRELIIMRIGWVTASEYEWTQHWRVATRLDIPEKDIEAVKDWPSSSLLTAADKAVLAATDETLRHGMISDETWSRCIEHLPSAAERIELVVAIGNWTLFSQMLKSLKIPLEDGVAPWPPDGIRPVQ